MKAVAVFPGTHEVRVIDEPQPQVIRGTEVLLRMREVGICGTDREVAAFEYGEPPPGEDHLIIGHEALGEVVAVGPEVTKLRPGDLVIPSVRRPCLHAECLACRSGRQDFCVTGDFRERGIKQTHGFLTESTVEDEANLTLVPPDLADVAVLTEPLTIAAKAMQQVKTLQQRLPWEPSRQRSVVLGAGPVGLLGAMTMVANNFETHVYSMESGDSDRADLVRSFGAGYICSQDCAPEDLGKRLGNIDLIYEAVGSSHLAFTALESLGPNGLFIFTGIPPLGGPSPLPADQLMRNIVLENQLIFGTVNASRSAYALALRLLGQCMALFPDSVRRIITAHRTIDEAPGMLRKRSGIKEVVRLS
ncbi:glucose 1-dehydrogenase [Corallococcus silvisoli]|uniref:glucose 1-dehydrogenase n=1 Tax=Corallococcus silvisoli TaxID=2697031 RepID=UPI001377AB73|nr:glucose 1-dehydrogenase [Corallococcus silvisoli]NBD09963.1 alcohol dehydrogenase catalytic domain-containing protein [Corallococcus silvisoli]